MWRSYCSLDRRPATVLGACLDGIGHLARAGAKGAGRSHFDRIDDEFESAVAGLQSLSNGPPAARMAGARSLAAGLMRYSLAELLGKGAVIGDRGPVSYRDAFHMARTDPGVAKLAAEFANGVQFDALLRDKARRIWAVFEVQYGWSEPELIAAFDRLTRFAYFTQSSISLAALVVVVPQYDDEVLGFAKAVVEIGSIVQRDFGIEARRPDQYTKPFLIRSALWLCADGHVICLGTGRRVVGFGAVAISYQYNLA